MKKDSWVKPRHKLILKLFKPFFALSGKKYGLTVEKCREKGPFLVLMNHQTPMDQCFASLVFSNPVYYVATEDIFSNGIVSRLLSWAVAPIPIDKTKVDVSTIRNCLKVAKSGSTVAIAPEGNRTYSGETCNMKSSIAKLVKMLKLPIAFLLFEGGYGVEPRWSDKTRRGKMKVGVSKIVRYEDYCNLSDEELFELIKKELYVNEGCVSGLFKSRRRAEYLERAVYTCPVCNGFAEWHSHKNEATCKRCGTTVTYGEDKVLRSPDGKEFAHPFLRDWLQAQTRFVNGLTLEKSELLFTDGKVKRSLVIPYKRKKVLNKNACLQLFTDKIVFKTKKEELTWTFDEISGTAVMGRNKLNVNVDGKLYQFKASKRFNALKYMNLWYRHKNIKEGESEFIGI